jgi:hypothetical protein
MTETTEPTTPDEPVDAELPGETAEAVDELTVDTTPEDGE